MGQTTFANSRGIAHKGSGGMSIAFPDVCMTPAPPAPFVPIPYPNIGKSSDTSKGPKKVKTDGKMPMTKGAKYSRSAGDEADPAPRPRGRGPCGLRGRGRRYAGPGGLTGEHRGGPRLSREARAGLRPVPKILIQRGRISVPIPAVMKKAVASPSTSAVCHTPGGLTIA